jgi:hypothetical protein
MSAVRLLALFFLTGIGASLTQAHPVTYRGGTAFSAVASEESGTVYLNRSLTRRDGIELRGLWWEPNDQSFRHQAIGVHYNRLVWRGFGRYQANLYAGAGPALIREGNTSDEDLGLSWQVQADYETLRVYTMARSSGAWGPDWNHAVTQGQLGWAPYAANYGDWATWLMVDAKHTSGWEEGLEVTPFLRFFNGYVFLEFGMSLDGKPFGQFMVHF